MPAALMLSPKTYSIQVHYASLTNMLEWEQTYCKAH